MKLSIFITILLWRTFLSAQLYIVNAADDLDDGNCDSIHCSLREAIHAAESDGVPSTIHFSISGPGPHEIIPDRPFPSITQDDLSIIGETQPGAPGSVVIDFNFRDFGGVGFLNVLGRQFYLSGLEFTDFLFNNDGDHIIQFGNSNTNAAKCKIYNCAFITDNSLPFSSLNKILIRVYQAENIIISHNYFGTDHTLSYIQRLEGFIQIEKNQGFKKVVIDSNVFVNKVYMIKAFGGDLSISKNIFGALDSSKQINFLNPQYAISGKNVKKALIHDNFFFGTIDYSIAFSSSNGELIISKNQFYDCSKEVILINDNVSGTNYIVDNYARNGGSFLDAIANQNDTFYVERNVVDVFEFFLLISNYSNQYNDLVRYIDNQMTCINRDVVSISGGRAPPKIISVNGNLITGSGVSNDSIIVYFNERNECHNANCQGGVELGRTKADLTGNWILIANYPAKAAISAYQFNSDTPLIPNNYSAFSPCYFVITGNNEQTIGTDVNNTNIYPNPVVDKIKIELNEAKSLSIVVYNFNGQKVMQLNSISKTIELDLENCNPGIYYIQFLGKDGTQQKKVLKI